MCWAVAPGGIFFGPAECREPLRIRIHNLSGFSSSSSGGGAKRRFSDRKRLAPFRMLIADFPAELVAEGFEHDQVVNQRCPGRAFQNGVGCQPSAGRYSLGGFQATGIVSR
jgi:hypothetical protein